MKKNFVSVLFLLTIFFVFTANNHLAKACWWNCSPTGLNWVWGQTASGPNFNQGKSVSVDYDGNVYVTGYFSGTTSFGDMQEVTLSPQGEATSNVFLAKYNSDGKLLWIRQAGGTGLYASAAGWDVSLDHEGNAYITGEFNQEISFDDKIKLKSAGVWDIFVAKYDKDGNILWAHRAGSESKNYDEDVGTSIKVTEKAVYVTGNFGDNALFGENPNGPTIYSMGGNDIFIAAYDFSGELLWVKSAGGTNVSDKSLSVSADFEENIYIAGYFDKKITFGENANVITLTSSQWQSGFIAKYSSNGDLLWAKKISDLLFDVNTDKYSMTADITNDFNGNIIITGYFPDESGPVQSFIAKLGPNGNLLWLKLSNLSANSTGQALTVDGKGNVYAAGSFTKPLTFNLDNNTLLSGSGSSSLYLYKFGPEGNFIEKNVAKTTNGRIPFGFWGYNMVGIDINGKNGYFYMTTGFNHPLHLGALILFSFSTDMFSSNMVLARLK